MSLYASANGHEYGNVIAENSFIHQGDVYNYGSHHAEPELVVHYGLCLGSAPSLGSDNFVGRVAEIESMQQILHPGATSNEQRQLVLAGMGGMGKTQLALAYARRHQASYSSVFWINATSELTVKAGFRAIAARLLKVQEMETLSDDQAIARALEWLQNIRNTKWLLILDNHDDPDQFPLANYYPAAAHGSIIITTRLIDRIRGQQIRLQPLSNVDEGFRILQTRSRRDNITRDPDALRLVERLQGLPLALATAGAYLSQTTLTVAQYLEAYERSWIIDRRRPLRLQEYQDRTLYTTWDLSFARLQADDPNAAQLLGLLAYFDNQKLWFKLLKAGITGSSPKWLRQLFADQMEFESLIRALVEYCFIEVQTATASFSMHNCIHDWTLAVLNEVIDADQYWYAFMCVAKSIEKEDHWAFRGQLHYAPLVPHAVRLTHDRYFACEPIYSIQPTLVEDALKVIDMLVQQHWYAAAEQLSWRGIAGIDQAKESDRFWAFDLWRCLGNLYRQQSKLDESEKMYLRGLDGTEQLVEANHLSCLHLMECLGDLYRLQGKLDKAEQLLQRVLSGREKLLGPDDILTLKTMHSIGVIYQIQRKLDEVERIYLDILPKFEKSLEPDDNNILCLIDDIGILYCNQGRLPEAEQMLERAIAGYDKKLGPQHPRPVRARQVLADLRNDMRAGDNCSNMEEQKSASPSSGPTKQDKRSRLFGKFPKRTKH